MTMSTSYGDEAREGKPKEVVAESPTKVYNLLWVSPTFPVPGEQFWQPVPSPTVENMQGIADRNQNVDVQLYVDSRRLTDAQMGWLEKMMGECPAHNMSLVDLCTIPEYSNNQFYNQPDNSPNWRFNKHSLIWRQVDAARIVACLQSSQDQVFYSDADITNLVVDSSEVQSKLKKHGIILSGGVHETMGLWYENQLFGFDGKKRGFFRSLYDRTLRDVAMKGENGHGSYINMIDSELTEKENIDLREIVFQARYDGTAALHPRPQIATNSF